jgi:ABC-2 type transport system permease protein
MHNIFLIARREYLQQIRGRAFKFSTVLVPLLMAALLAASYFTGRNAAPGKHVTIVANDTGLAEQLRREMLYDTKAKFTVDVVARATPENRAALLKQLQAKTIDGILAVDASPARAVTATYTSLSAGGFQIIGGLQNYLRWCISG